MGKKLQNIAIIGMSGRFPGSNTVAEFWANLCKGERGITFPTDEQLRAEGVPDNLLQNPNYVRAVSAVDDYDCFDSAFFGIHRQDASIMDPQHRVLLECAWAAIEDAGYSPDGFPIKVGVFAGSGGIVSSHILSQAEHFTDVVGKTGGAWHLGNDKDFAPTRVSYKLNLRGPSVAVQTACSTSLVAVHLACQSIRAGECEAALAGAVSIRVPHRVGYLFAPGEIYSSDGHVRAFDAGANGVVFGSGVGLVLLKALETAIADGDNIYAVIKGSAINNDGANKMSFMATKMDGQIDCIRAALKAADVAPSTLRYVEAHGTGTAMGDPVEISALTKAFRDQTSETQFCAIGSLKNNIGHLDIAAGIASLVKVSLALKFNKIPACINFDKKNPKIDFEKSPFYVNTELLQWDGNESPRRAAINCLGIGGTNAFFILEEAPPAVRADIDACDPQYLIVLSAKSEAAMWRKIADLAGWLEREDGVSMADCAYTLCVGRSSFAWRCAVVASDIDDLKGKLSRLLSEKQAENCFLGSNTRNTVDTTIGIAEFSRYLVDRVANETRLDSDELKNKLVAIADLYCRGVDFCLGSLFGARKYQRVSLPSYPFERNRFEICAPKLKQPSQRVVAGVAQNALHPLLHRNLSSISGLQFGATFSGEEFFLLDHVVKNRHVLPGVAHLELAREAVARSLDGSIGDGHGTFRIQNVVWATPIRQGDGVVDVRIGLFPEDDGKIAFQIYGDSAQGDGSAVVFSQGTAIPAVLGAAPEIPLAELLARCQRGTRSSEECYEAFRAMGFDYGVSFRGIERLHLGDGQVVAQVAVPAAVAGTHGEYVLHPSLLDAALQATIGVGQGSAGGQPVLPFALGSLEVYGRCPAQAWAWIRYSAGSGAGDAVRKLDIDLCDAQGAVWVRLKGFTARVLEKDKAAVATRAEPTTLLLKPQWRAAAAGAAGAAAGWVVLCGMPAAWSAALEQRLPGVRCRVVEAAEGVGACFAGYAHGVLGTLQEVLSSRPRQAVRVQVVVSAQAAGGAGLAGMLKTAQQENPQVHGQLIQVDALSGVEEVVEVLAGAGAGAQVRVRGGCYETLGWEEVRGGSWDSPWKAGGVYLITGGVGGLGVLFAQEAAARAEGVRLILTGRTAAGAHSAQVLEQLRQRGAQARYEAVDVNDAQAVDELIAGILAQEGSLQGIVHSAGVLRDSFLLKKTDEELQAVLGAKVHGVVHLDESSRGVELDFFVLFSSLSAALGNVGQADYAAGNGFMDDYARYRNGQVAQGQRQGRTVSINWPLWAHGGMRVDAAKETWLREQAGMTPLQTGAGVEAFYQALSSGEDQVLVLSGAVERLRRAVTGQSKREAAPREAAAARVVPAAVGDRVLSYLVEDVSQLLKVKREDVEADAELSEYGFDSISLTEFANRLNARFGLELMPTVFFEYPTLRGLSGHLTQAYGGVFAERLGVRAAVAEATAQPAAEPVRASQPLRRWRTGALPASAKPEAVAVIGMSGCFPQAADMETFWTNLKAGKDCIEEIPAARWDWRAWYGDPQTQANRTNIKWGGFIGEVVEEFDPLFFGISPREAVLMDPQQRLLMRYGWAALEDAGYSGSRVSGSSTGIFVGTGSTGYVDLVAQAQWQIEGYSSTGAVPSVGPNRMSYFLNVHGPSEPIETACSSSLVAIHRALQAMHTGGCEMALVGGIQTIVTPVLHISFNKAGMLSQDGRCKTFSDRADGYVRGEGVGMLLLKRLSAAEADRDHIYGVIIGSAQNHGGRATSLTAPNPKAQAELLKAAYRQAGIDPRSVGYIEAHGTGTALGDPVEVNALKAAFASLYAEHDASPDGAHCGLGTVKSNIGHLELAAGIAGVIKVLLQLKHRTLVPTLHCERLNPYIDLSDSPFYVVQQTTAWAAPTDGHGRALPRRAGISSFGFGGANAHVVVEEYCAPAREEQAIGLPGLVVLSAKNEERLQAQAQQLLEALRSGRYEATALWDIAYTLQVGREAMEERLGLVAQTLAEVEATLAGYVSGQSGAGVPVYRGQVKRNKDALGVFEAQDLQSVVGTWMAQGQYGKLLDLWVKGLVVDWDSLYGSAKPRRVSLPTYPFAQERYWITAAASPAAAATQLHPLVHSNISDAQGLKYGTQLEQPLSGMGYVELGRAAVAQGLTAPAGVQWQVEGVQWSAAAAQGAGAVSLEVELYVDTAQSAGYEIYAATADGERQVHGQGRVRWVAEQAAPQVDLSAAQGRCAGGSWVADEAVVWLGAVSAPAGVVLPPAVLEAVLGAVGGLAGGTLWPREVAQVRAYGAAPEQAWACLRRSAGGVDVAVCGASGQVWLQVEGLQVQAAQAAQAERGSGVDVGERVLHKLKGLFARTAKLGVEKLEASEPLESYGIDSLMITQLSVQFTGIFGEVSKTLLYEYQTLSALADYFVTQHRGACERWCGVSAVAAVAAVAGEPAAAGLRSWGAATGTWKRTGTREPIAIIGLSGRYPQAPDVETFWKNLVAGKDCIEQIPAERWAVEAYYTADRESAEQGKYYAKWGGFVAGFAEFDPLFFGISPREALNMDPQERLFVQACWSTLEDAGYTRDRLARQHGRRVGVFAGITKTGFDLHGPGLWSQGEAVHPHTSFGSVANRISYVLNLAGPSMPVDTMCSASLTAIHEACEHLYREECELALAGGVNLYLHPSTYVGLCAQRMLSSSGRCRSFGLGGDGFVPGEGVGVVLLKGLSQAQRDADVIYAVIRGTGINHGGKTNGYTVPSPVAQGQLIRATLDKAGVDARTVSYIEAHGTGTELGDPIEISGLVQAFETDTQQRQFCAIGSVKTNIGHLEAAAGIAGLTKLVLQLKHGQLVPSLHAQELNPNIDFANTPFVVQRQLTAWSRPVVDGREYARIGGISSFGAGGANAHVVVEEYCAPAREEQAIGLPGLVVLSAKNEERLQAQAQQLLEALRSGRYEATALWDIAYTLQVGREAMEERLGLVAQTLAEVEATLAGYVSGQSGAGVPVYRGQVKRNKDALGVFEAQDLQSVVGTWMAQGQYGKLLDLWVKGLVVDWDSLYGSAKPRRVSLPTYPFARERYWITASATPAARTAQLHPLVHSNTSDFEEQRFSSRFSGEEFFLADHVIGTQRVLPGVAYLEMARAALERTLGSPSSGLHLSQVVWVRPLAVGATGQEVHVRLQPLPAGGAVGFEVYTTPSEGEVVIHCQGLVEAVAAPEHVPDCALAERLQACGQQPYSAEQYYELFAQAGMHYGAGHQGVQAVHVGDGQVVAQVAVPAAVAGTHGEYVLHPSLLDAALQATIGVGQGSAGGQPVLPFALGSLEVYGRCPAQAWAWIRYSAGSGAGDAVRKLDIDLCDAQGAVWVRLKGFTARVLEKDKAAVATRAEPTTLLLKPQWRAAAAGAAGAAAGWVVLCGMPAAWSAALEQRLPGVRCRVVEAAEGVGACFAGYAHGVLGTLQEVLSSRPRQAVRVQVVVSAQAAGGAGLAGMLKTAQQENPQVHGQLIQVDALSGVEEVVEVLAGAGAGAQVRVRGGCYETLGWEEVRGGSWDSPWKAGGVYLITGGVGGLGVLFAQEAAARAEGVRLILTGRTAAGAHSAQVLEQLRQRGAQARYEAVDVNDAQAVDELIAGILAQEGSLQGIVHSAGVLRDSFLLKKTDEELQAVLGAKVHGVVHLDESSRGVELDFFVLFSSLSAALGNVGQADYAAGNGFMDDYARYRNGQVAQGQRQGRTVSINWPLWAHGGMRVDAAKETWLREQAGMTPLQTGAGVEAFYQALSSGEDQVLVLSGAVERLRRAVTGQSKREAAPREAEKPAMAVAPSAGTELREKAIAYFKRLLAGILKLPAHRIEADAALEHYGIDSIMVTDLTNQLERTFGPLSKTLFFEYQNIQALVEYFLSAYREPLQGLLGIGMTDQRTVELPAIAGVPGAVAGAVRRWRTTARHEAVHPAADAESEIAIVGVSGRYPGAATLEAFWENLREGKDSVTQIPPARWDYRAYSEANAGEGGKGYCQWGGFLDGVEEFDPLFFNISPREARMLDPQERLFLQCAFATLEDAGYTRQSLRAATQGKVGVYVGVMYEEYPFYGVQAQQAGEALVLSGSPASIANRVSYFCDFHGPSLALDSMCSSSLSTIHLACQSLLRGECELALAGGVNVSIHPNKYLLLQQGQFSSSTGRCESFGEGGDGYVPGEGVGAVLLKPKAKAQADNDHIYGVIKATAINHGGKTNGYTVPNPHAQAQVIEQALREGGVEPRWISYVEAHGTGTALGDPIEITGLSKAFAGGEQPRQYCAIGSVKSNIGHCESAAGIAGVTKVLLQMRYGQIAPSLHSTRLNPNIDFAESAFWVPQRLTDWTRPQVEIGGRMQEVPRLAGVSSFGAGGANAHVIIEEYPQAPRTQGVAGQTQAIVLSARTPAQLRARAEQLLAAITAGRYDEAQLVDVAYTLQVGREAMEERLGMLVDTLTSLGEKLRDYVEDKSDEIADIYFGQVKSYKATLSAFAADEEFQETLSKWLERRKLSKLLQAWVTGVEIDWSRLHRDPPRRVSLPTYPFAQERYWGAGPVASPGNVATKAPSNATQDTMLVKDWREAPLDSAKRPGSGVVVILATQATTALAAAVRARFGDLEVLVATHDVGDSSGEFHTDYYQEEAGERLYQEIKTPLLGKALSCVIDICSYDSDYEDSVCTETGKIRFLQRIVEHERNGAPTLLQVTCRLNSWRLSSPSMQGARLFGLYRMLGAEYAQIRSESMDSDLTLDRVEELSAQILQEISKEKDPNRANETCYRDGIRFAPTLTAVDLCKDPLRGDYSSDDVVLITGGTRGIGAALAEHVVASGVRRLAILGREDLPPRQKWAADAVQASRGGVLRSRLRQMQSLIERGVDVHYFNASLTDVEGMKTLVDAVRERLGPVTGVFHCAGSVSANPAFLRKRIAEFESVLAPKIAGLANLHDALKSQPLRFFVLFSSVAAVVPSLAIGQSDYAMANAYMDCYVAHHSRNGCAYLKSIQWPRWRDVGMGVGLEPAAAYVRSGFNLLSNSDALRTLDLMVGSSLAVGMPYAMSAQTQGLDALLSPRGVPSPAKPVDAIAVANRLDSEAHVGAKIEHRRSIGDWLKGVMMTELGLSESDVDPDKPFAEYGVDSILIVQIGQAVQKSVDRPLDPALLFEHNSISALIDYFERGGGYVSIAESATAKKEPSTPVRAEIEAVGQERMIVANLAQASPGSIARSRRGDEEIAVVGLSCRLPGAPDASAFWQLLSQGRSAIKPLPDNRWRGRGDSEVYGGWIEGVDLFDAAYFRLKESDAAIMDPQARLLLEEALSAIHDAGYRQEEPVGQKVGVYIGGRAAAVGDDIAHVLRAPNPILGLGQNYLAANISRFFNFSGPSLVVDTACSSGITGMSFAADALRAGTIDAALVGSVSLLLNEHAHELFAARNILNKNGEFHIFDRNASGEVLGEGVGMVVLKRLRDAVRDGNQIYGIVRAIAVNNDGRTIGPGSPNLNAQKQVIRDALEACGMRPQDIGYLEVNGGGSLVVDAVEIKALAEAYQLKNTDLGFCHVGSIKPNLGHLLLSSGIAGFIRCVLSVHQGSIPPFLSALEPFEHFDFSASRIRFNRKTVPWSVHSKATRVAAQNSFADGGTNCHVIVEQFVPPPEYRVLRPPVPMAALQRRSYSTRPTVNRPIRLQEGPYRVVAQDPDRFGIGKHGAAIDGQVEVRSRSVINFWGEFREESV